VKNRAAYRKARAGLERIGRPLICSRWADMARRADEAEDEEGLRLVPKRNG